MVCQRFAGRPPVTHQACVSAQAVRADPVRAGLSDAGYRKKPEEAAELRTVARANKAFECLHKKRFLLIHNLTAYPE